MLIKDNMIQVYADVTNKIIRCYDYERHIK